MKKCSHEHSVKKNKKQKKKNKCVCVFVDKISNLLGRRVRGGKWIHHRNASKIFLLLEPSELDKFHFIEILQLIFLSDKILKWNKDLAK